MEVILSYTVCFVLVNSCPAVACMTREVFMAHYVYVSQKVDSGYVRDPARGAAIWFRVFTKTRGDSGDALG